MRIKIILISTFFLVLFLLASMYIPVVYQYQKDTYQLSTDAMFLPAMGMAILWIMLLAGCIVPIVYENIRDK